LANAAFKASPESLELWRAEPYAIVRAATALN
jgi:hypothetical protein